MAWRWRSLAEQWVAGYEAMRRYWQRLTGRRLMLRVYLCRRVAARARQGGPVVLPGRAVGDVTPAGQAGGGGEGRAGEAAGQLQPTGVRGGDVSIDVGGGSKTNEGEEAVTSDGDGDVNSDSVAVQLG